MTKTMIWGAKMLAKRLKIIGRPLIDFVMKDLLKVEKQKVEEIFIKGKNYRIFAIIRRF